MALISAVDRLIAAISLSPAGEVTAESLRLIAARIDEGDASAAVSAQLHRELIVALERLTEEAPQASAPRLGLLRGEHARVVLLGLGYENPDVVDLEEFNLIEALRLKRSRRLAGLPEQPGLQALIDQAIARAGRPARGVVA